MCIYNLPTYNERENYGHHQSGSGMNRAMILFIASCQVLCCAAILENFHKLATTKLSFSPFTLKEKMQSGI